MPSHPSVPSPSASSLLDLSALEQARLIRERRLSSAELVGLYLKRIAAHDPTISSFVEVNAERAMEEARKRDRGARGGDLPPFWGVPIGVKDLHMMRGTRTQMGSRAYRWLRTPVDDATVRALRKAGFVLVGKTSTSELGLLPIVETDIHPATRNAWNPEYTAGGSSGGAGAAVGAGLLPVAPGSDGAGSVRIPASLNGLFGIKPTRGRVPNPHKTFDVYGMTAIGPIARSVEDGAALMDALCGRDPLRDPGFLTAARRAPGRHTIGLLLEAPVGPTDPAIAAAVEGAARALEALGHTIVPVRAPMATLEEFLPVYQRLLASVPVIFEGQLQPMTQWFRAEGRGHRPADVDAAFHSLSARANAVIDGCDVVMTPTIPVRPPRVGEHARLSPAEGFRALASLGAFTAASNITGAPAATVPWALDEGGVPIGVQIIGRQGQDERVLALARQIERAREQSFGVSPRFRG